MHPLLQQAVDVEGLLNMQPMNTSTGTPVEELEKREKLAELPLQGSHYFESGILDGS